MNIITRYISSEMSVDEQLMLFEELQKMLLKKGLLKNITGV